jgi:hypothetical protein
MKHLKALLMVLFGLEDEPSTGNTIGTLIALLFICMMLILSTGALA